MDANSGKVALVTGASRGLGVAISAALAEAGWMVAVNYFKDDAGAERTVAEVRNSGGQAEKFKFDVTEAAAVAAGVATIVETLGPVDLVVNNATGPQGGAPIMEQNWAMHLRHLEFFVKAPLVLLQAVLPDWRARKSGRVINVGSSVVKAGSPFDSAYVAAKAAMVGLTRSWASELGPEGITVNLVSPGWTPVERHAGADPATLERHARSLPLRRLGKPADVAGAVVFLGSVAADYITGQDIAVDGGRNFS
jgi:3-oxoacyl-[acyl-carrier protein] reductase